LRLTGNAGADVIAETFLTAWRRIDHNPAGEAALPWLYGVARRVLANQRRGEQRRTALGERLRSELAAEPYDREPPPGLGGSRSRSAASATQAAAMVSRQALGGLAEDIIRTTSDRPSAVPVQKNASRPSWTRPRVALVAGAALAAGAAVAVAVIVSAGQPGAGVRTAENATPGARPRPPRPP
jgi:hypothetical protein